MYGLFKTVTSIGQNSTITNNLLMKNVCNKCVCI